MRRCAQEFLRFLALTYDALFSEDQEILDDGDVAALGFATQRGGDRDRKKSHAQLKVAGKKSRLEELGAALGSGNEQASAGTAGGDEGAMARMGRTDATRVLAGFLQVVAEMTPARASTLVPFCPTPCTLHTTHYTLHPTPYALHPAPYTLHPAPCTLHPTPYALHPTPYALHPTPYTPNPKA